MDRAVRQAGTRDNPVFVHQDVCSILGIEHARNAHANMEDYCKGCGVRVHTLGGIQEVQTLTEAGLYTLILRSNKPAAKPFIRWVTTEVLPSIRKTGGYSLYSPGSRPFLSPEMRQTLANIDEATNPVPGPGKPDHLAFEMARLLQAALGGRPKIWHTPQEMAQIARELGGFDWIFCRPDLKLNGAVSLGCYLARRSGIVYTLPDGTHARLFGMGNCRHRRYLLERIDTVAAQEVTSGPVKEAVTS